MMRKAWRLWWGAMSGEVAHRRDFFCVSVKIERCQEEVVWLC